MCGVVAVVRGMSRRKPPEAAEVFARLDDAQRSLSHGPGGLAAAAGSLGEVNRLLGGVPGLRALLGDATLATDIEDRLTRLDEAALGVEAHLDGADASVAGASLEAANAALVLLKDALWALRHDRLRAARSVASLGSAGWRSRAWRSPGGPPLSPAAIAALASIDVALSALDRLEVRGRDSAGLHLLLTGHRLDFDAPDVAAELDSRRDRLFCSMAACTPAGHLSIVYKAASEIGELGDNTAALRAAIMADGLLHRALESPDVEVTVLGHTRWASVGIISAANAHPLNSEEQGVEAGSYVAAALNGDVDNYLELCAAHDLCIPREITTDAKIIPVLIGRRIAAGESVAEAFRHTVATFDGSVAVGGVAAAEPDTLHFALRGSGQGLYVGFAEDAFVVASEPYGLVEQTPVYLRLDGESTGGQVVGLRRDGAGTVAGIRRTTYDGSVLPVVQSELHTAEITTRDIDRGGYPHYLVKEITEAPQSWRKTLRGKIVNQDGLLTVKLGEETLSAGLCARLAAGQIRRILIVGQGTAAVAGQSLAAALTRGTAGTGLLVTALPATELSGFGLTDDMSDTLVIAVSQSGTTTDTNRTVDLVRSRGATVLAIVNRRHSDLAERADGVLYTSDGRDVEMSVASTKAFYAQIAAGWLLALAISDALGCGQPRRTHELASALRAIPNAMEEILAGRDVIAEAAQLAPQRRYWAVVGNGSNRIAALEIRIKLSELCYKSIACDATEDKKHIDLSSEPLILVCAAGLRGPNADDVAKEIAIYRAHKATPIVIASEGVPYPAAQRLLTVPAVHPDLDFVLATVVGHLFGYEAALAIDAQARTLREVRAVVESIVSASDTDGLTVLDRLAPRVAAAAAPFFAGLAAGGYNGHLEASTAVRVASLLRFVSGALPLDLYELESGKVGNPAAMVEDLVGALTGAIDELTRPVDAIKHQAKTVTVGISRSEDAILAVPLVRAVLATGAHRDQLSYRALRTLAALDPAVAEVTGFTRYRVEGSFDGSASATIHVFDRGGVAATIPSRTDANPVLLGTKHRVARQREVTVARGASDGRTIVLIPEQKGGHVVGIDLLHCRFVGRLDPATARSVLSGYGPNRLGALVDAITETEREFDDARLADVDVIELLTQPVQQLADLWRPA